LSQFQETIMEFQLVFMAKASLAASAGRSDAIVRQKTAIAKHRQEANLMQGRLDKPANRRAGRGFSGLSGGARDIHESRS
jgi:hypothetical protein